MNKGQFTPEELTPFVLMVCLVVFISIYNYARGYREFWSPLTIIAVVYGYYCCIGPYEAILSGATYDRLLNMRKFYPSAFWGALISLLSYMAGYFFHGKSLNVRIEPPASAETVFKFGKIIFIIGFTLFTISTGGNVTKLINPLDAEYVASVGGSFANYLSLSLNFIIPGITMMFVYFLITRQKVLWFIIPFILALGIFTTLGFRYRIVLLLASIVIVYFQVKEKRPNPFFIYGGFIVLVSLMGVINLTRTYGTGLKVEKLEGESTEAYYKSGLQEAMIFQTSGAIIDIVPKKHPHAGLQPIWSTLAFPIPSKIIGEKNSAKYLFDALDAIYGKKYSKGAAILAYSEYYLALGWFGLVAGCFITGWFLRKLWNWFLANSDNPIVLVTYAVSASFLYVVISRGYLPQITTLFFFTVFPAFFVVRRIRKRSRIISSPFH